MLELGKVTVLYQTLLALPNDKCEGDDKGASSIYPNAFVFREKMIHT